MMRGCNYQVSLFTKYDFIEQCFIFVTWSDRRLAKVTSNVVIGPGNNNNNDRVQTNNSITPL